MEEVPKKSAEKTKPKAKRFYRSGKEKILGGVCGGIGEYFNVDPVLIRLILVLFVFALSGGAGILVYLIAWVIIPRNPDHDWKDDD